MVNLSTSSLRLLLYILSMISARIRSSLSHCLKSKLLLSKLTILLFLFDFSSLLIIYDL